MAKFVEEVAADELAGIVPTKPAAAATAAAPAVAKTAVPVEEAAGEEVEQEGTVAEKGDIEDVEFGDEELMKDRGLHKLLPEKGTLKKVRASIIGAVKPKKGYSHWIPGKGTFACHSVRDKHGNITEAAICCTEGKEGAEMSIACLAVHYTNAPGNDGKYVIIKGEDGKARYKDPVEFDIKWVKLSRSGYATLSGLPPEELTRSWSTDTPNVYDIDFTYCWKNQQGGGFNYAYAGKARWRSDPAVQAAVMEAIKPYLDGKRLKAKLGKQATLLELKAALSGASAETTEEAELGNIENL